jgi:hypothetical protein
MKKTEQRWMHIDSGKVWDADNTPCEEVKDNYRLVTVTPVEMETVEVTRYGIEFTNKPDNPFNFCHDLWNTRGAAQEYLDGCCSPGVVVEYRSSYTRPKPEPEPEVWEGILHRRKMML